jgi:hypothetical protein
MDHALSPTPDARDAHALQRHAGDRAVLAGCWLARLEPSPDDGVDAAWRDARERRRHARDQGRVEAGTRADRLVVNGAPQADVTRRRGNNRDQQGFPFTERWEGSRDWKPDMPRGSVQA